MPPRSKNSLIDELIQEYRAAGNQDHAFDSVAAAQLGVSETDLRCLNIIENERGLTAGELARGAGLTAGAVTGVVDRLEQRGYARRVPDPSDRRRVRIEVTQAFLSGSQRDLGARGGGLAQRADRAVRERGTRADHQVSTLHERARTGAHGPAPWGAD